MKAKTLIFGHRGVPVKFPENSLKGFKYALDHQIDGLELDVHLTRDNVPVVIHDEKLQRTTNGQGQIADYTLSELKRFRLSDGQRIPTLKEVLNLVEFHDIFLNLELKTNLVAYPGIEEIVLRMVENSKLKYPVIYSSFNIHTLRRCRQIDPHQDYNLLSAAKLIKQPKKFLLNEGLSGLHTNHFQFANICQRAWTINSSYKAMILLSLGVSGIITDDFEKMTALRDKYQTQNELPSLPKFLHLDQQSKR